MRINDTFTVDDGMPLSIFQNKYARLFGLTTNQQAALSLTDVISEYPKSEDTLGPLRQELAPDWERLVGATQGAYESWQSVADRVVYGNLSLAPGTEPEFAELRRLSRAGVMPFAGRHLQHGDLEQAHKRGELFTNCSTAMFSFVKFWLMMKGSGVGRLYDSDLCRVNWDNLPECRFVLSNTHSDYAPHIESREDAERLYDSEGENTRWFEVEDSTEGLTKVIEIMETAAFQERHHHKMFIFDFTPLRDKGTPIRGQQGRPSSGPLPFIDAFQKVARIRGAGMPLWMQSMYVDHYMSASVQLGGIRRAARIAVRSWRQKDIFEFINIKRGGFLWSANNSVAVDAEFWEQASKPEPSHARRVFEAVTAAAYYDGTGEPAFLNVDQFNWLPDGSDAIDVAGLFQGLDVHPNTLTMAEKHLKAALKKKNPYLVNPCGEIVLAAWGGYCVLGNINLAEATQEEALKACELMPRFLMRTNKMKFLYQVEVDRTNRIGVGLTGIHEFAWRQFGLTFGDLLDLNKSEEFWALIDTMRVAVRRSACDYASVLDVAVPHTATTITPTGTVSKVVNVTEGAHLPAYAYYLRWVQFSEDDPAVVDLRKRGYPIQTDLKEYAHTVIVGYPTCLPIVAEMGDKITLAGDATVEQQFEWLRLLERFWIGSAGNQISFTLKYDPKTTTFDEYRNLLLTHMPTVKACSFMPQTDTSAYSYLPEEAISSSEYDSIVKHLERKATEGYDSEALACAGGACPIEHDING